MTKRTSLFAAGCGLLLTYEVLAHLDDTDPTISRYIWRACAYSPMVPFTVGVLCGHLFWQSRK